MGQGSVSGWSRARSTRLSVRLGERLSTVVITVGGIGTILSVAMIMVFLIAVVLPLFGGSEVEAAGDVELTQGEFERLMVDEYRVLAATVTSTGILTVQRFDTGEILSQEHLFDGVQPTCQSWSVGSREATFGFEDGTIRLANFDFVPETIIGDDIPAELQGLKPGDVVSYSGGVVECLTESQLRFQGLSYEVKDPVAVSQEPILRLDRSTVGPRVVVTTLDAEGRLQLLDITERTNLLTKKVTLKTEAFDLPYQPPPGLGVPSRVLVSGLGDQILAVWETGEALRFDARDREALSLAEVVDLVPEAGLRITALEYLVGKSTLAVGDSQGDVRGWFSTKPQDAGTVDGAVLAQVKRLEGSSAVTSIAPSGRSRLLAVGYADGSLKLFQMTIAEQLAETQIAGGAAVEALNLMPKEDGLACIAGGALHRFELDPKHHETNLRALFAPLWYESYQGPEHVWQSSGATDDNEPKLGLVPLIFGTLKATFYSLLFGAPIALLAAIYTSEFMNRRFRAPIKSVIEVMASLPSVVLGFLAALVIAPFVQRYLPAVLAVFFTLPLSLLVGAYVWQMLPRQVSLRLEGAPRLVAVGTAMLISIFLAGLVGPLCEDLMFGGNLELWLDGQVGSALGGWVFLLLPVAALGVALASSAFVNPWFRIKAAGLSHAASARASALKFVVAGAVTLLLALVAGFGLDAASLDPRQDLFGILGTYVQRNALVVGFVMGFAVIPIIYTLAEDALSSVPEHLRLASLGAGATPWQTAIRVVVPTAMSGLFSALMIGLGRAVGETMIVLMATGNTPVMDLNIFNGFRTLSANIAYELPEAVEHSTHYRTLFLAALVLFAMTFFLNTLAEVVRQRFRRRFHNL